MAWSASAVFTAFPKDAVDNTTAIDLGSDTPKVALYDNDITPDKTVTSANTAFNAGQWATSGNEVIDASGWPTGGRALVSATWTSSSGTITYDANDTASANSTTTLTDNRGCLVYDDTLAAIVVDQGICYLYFGGSQTITSGLYTVVYHANGIMTWTV
jgi:hypothetical protein